MYSSRLAPMNRSRSVGRYESDTTNAAAAASDPLVASSPLSTKGKSFSDTMSSLSIASSMMSGDYNVLKSGVDQHRSDVMDARLALASSLDRLGEHHVRQKEYDEAMEAFTEALHEKRSILPIRFPAWGGFSSSSMGAMQDDQQEEFLDERNQAIDDIVLTLRNMGNVHSLRGEQEEAMRYYSEVTNLCATKSTNNNHGEESSAFCSTQAGSGSEEDASTNMSEVNEDVKALDDMFRSISFRSKRESSSELWPVSRKSMPLGSSAENSSPSLRVKKSKEPSDHGSLTGLESEPFQRSNSIGHQRAGNELIEAIDAYRSVLRNTNISSLDQHRERLNSYSLRAELSANNGGNRPTRMEDLELALEIYQQVRSAQGEIRKVVEEQQGAMVPEVNASVASTLIRMGSLYYKLGKRMDELSMYEEAKTIYKNAFGENHAFVAGARKNIGMVLAEKGEYVKAVEQFDKAKRIYLAVRGGDSVNRDVASAISCMGNVKNRSGDLEEALMQYKEALDIYKTIQCRVTTAESRVVAIRDVTATLKVIGMVLAKMGNLDEAMKFFVEAMALLRSNISDASLIDREIAASVLTRMGSIFVKKGELDQAMEHYQEAYDLTVQNRGTSNHHEVASILHCIGGIFHKKSNLSEAMKCYEESIRIYHQTLGPGNPMAAGTFVMVGSIHYKRRNLDSALMFYREALRINREEKKSAEILKSIATILTKKGDFRSAHKLFRDVLSIKMAQGNGHPEVASAYKSLGNVHYKMGELEEAMTCYREALTIYRQALGTDHRDTVAAQTTIEHIRYWMREKRQKKTEERAPSSARVPVNDDERSC